jgi:hypothetical protein
MEGSIKFSKHDINLKKFFKKEIKKNILGTYKTPYPTYRSLMRMKKGVRLDHAPHNAPSTIKKKGFDHWMVETGELAKDGFEYSTKPLAMLIVASHKKHSSKYKNPPSYHSLFYWHNQHGYSGIFERLPVGSQFPKRLEKEVLRQMKKALVKQAKSIKKSVA